MISIGPKSGTKKDGFNLVTEKVTAINLEINQIEVELLAYDGKTVLLDVGEEAVEDLKKIKLGDGATLRVVEESGKRIVKSFRIRSKDPNVAATDAALLDLTDTHWLNRKHAIEVLGELRVEAAVKPLVEMLNDEDWLVRRNAAESLARLKDSRAIDPLVPLLEDENEMVRDTAEGALTSLGWTPSAST